MTLQVFKREIYPLNVINPIASVIWRLPVQALKQEVIEVSIWVIAFLFFMKLYYQLLRWIYPLLQKINPSYTRKLQVRLSFFFYEKIVPQPGKLLHAGVSLYRKI